MKAINIIMCAFMGIVNIFWLPTVASAQEVNMQAFMEELQQMKCDQEQMSMVWWLPNEWWEVNAKDDPTISQAMLQQMLQAVDSYLIFVVVEGHSGAFGGFYPETRESIISRISVVPHTGTELKPIKDKDLSYDIQNMFSVMKPLLANVLGQMGQGMEFIAFEVPRENSSKLLEARKAGAFTVRLGSQEFKWRLPLGSLLPEKVDPKTGDTFPGNYEFNPFTGDRLQPTK